MALKKVEKIFYFCDLFIFKTKCLQQLKETESSTLGMWRWFHEGTAHERGAFSVKKWYIKGKGGWISGRSLTGVTLSEAEHLVHSVSNIYDVPDPNLSSEGQILSIPKKLDCFSLFYPIFPLDRRHRALRLCVSGGHLGFIFTGSALDPIVRSPFLPS